MAMSVDDLNNFHIDVFREIANIGSGNAATALANMLNKKVDMDVPKVKILEFKDVTEMLGGAEVIVVGILLKVAGDLTGNMMFILEKSSAHILVNMLMGRPWTVDEQTDEFSEIEISALKEIGNILAGSYLSALTPLTGLRILPSVPDMAIDMAGAILSVPAIQFGKLGDTVLYIETEFSEDDKKVVGSFFLIPDVESYDILLKSLGVIS